MTIRFPDFQVLFARSTQGPQGARPAVPAESLAHHHAQAAAIEQQNVRRRTTVNEGEKSQGATGKRRRGERGGPSPREKGRHLDIQA